MNRYERVSADVSPSVAGQVVPREGSESAGDYTTSPMFNYASQEDEPSDTTQAASKHNDPELFAHDCSSNAEGELLAVYSPSGGAMDGQIFYARPRDCVALEDAR